MIFEQTQRTPYVEIGSNACVIRGECYPENISEWSGPVLEALEGAMQHDNGSFEVSIELYYFNSSSAKFLFDFFEYLEEISKFFSNNSLFFPDNFFPDGSFNF